MWLTRNDSQTYAGPKIGLKIIVCFQGLGPIEWAGSWMNKTNTSGKSNAKFVINPTNVSFFWVYISERKLREAK